MQIRVARPSDADAVAQIYAPFVRDTIVSFERDPPSSGEMQARIAATLERLPWLVSLDESNAVSGYAYASRHRERAAYQWAVDTAVYIRADQRGKGIGRRLYTVLFEELVALGYFQAIAGITLPNEASVGLHESLGFARIGVYRNVGFKCGAWRDVGWWQKQLRPLQDPADPLAFRAANPA